MISNTLKKDFKIIMVSGTDSEIVKYIPLNLGLEWTSVTFESENNEYEQLMNYRKAETFIGLFLEDSFWCSDNHVKAVTQMFYQTDNGIVHTPSGMIHELAACLFSKLNTLTGPSTLVTSVVLVDKDVGISYNIDCDELEFEVPESLPTFEEWKHDLDVVNTVTEEAWWVRDDISTMDLLTVDNDDMALTEEYKNLMRAPFDKLETEVKEELNLSAEVVSLDFSNKKWKPLIV